MKGLTGIDVPGADRHLDGRAVRRQRRPAAVGLRRRAAVRRAAAPAAGPAAQAAATGRGERSRPDVRRRTRREPPASGRRSAASRGRARRAQTVGAAMDAAVTELGRTADRARAAVDRAIGQPGHAEPPRPTATPAPATPPRHRARRGRPVARPGPRSTLDEAAQALADDLMRIPGIQRFGAMRLADLETSGPRPLRTMWRIARDRLERDYGELTIGEIIDRYRGGGGGVSAGA